MTQREIWQLVAHVRTLGRAGEGSVRGDVQKGAALVKGKGGCIQCHVLDGQGGHMGPPLTDIGTRRSPAYLRAKLIDPASDLTSEFSTVKVTTREGKTLNGVRMNEDTYSIQLRDNNLGLHSFWKQDLANVTVERRTTMPSYAKRMTDQELNDIVAFLASTGGRP